MPIERIHVTTRYSEAAIYQGVVYVAGQVPTDRTLDVSGQTADVLACIEQRLLEAGSDKNHILMATIYLADMADYATMNAVWDAWLNAGHAPPRACVQAALADPAWKVEIVVTAAQVSCNVGAAVVTSAI